jgi:transcriptional regulator with XRE-family HTH domain
MAASDIGLTVSAARNRAGLTQEELAAKAGTTRTAISRIETGKPARGVPDDRIDAIFRSLRGLPPASRQARYVKWWRDNGPRT